jgi:cytoskeletal protein RodZ
VANQSKETAYEKLENPAGRIPRVLGLGFLSVASAAAGGLAVAWWYRKTLAKLQNPIEKSEIQESEAQNAENDEDEWRSLED